MSVEVFASELIPAGRIKELPGNPNSMTERVFQRTVRNILEEGFVEPVYVACMGPELRRLYLTPEEDAEGGDWYLIIGGHHRFRAGLTLDMDQFPAIVKHGLSDKQVKAQCARMNRLRGKPDVRKLMAFYEELAKEDGDEVAADAMAFMDEAELKRMMRDARESLPEPLREKLDARAPSIGTVDDMTRVIAEILATAGDTVPNGFLLFEYANQTHFRIEMSAELLMAMEALRSAVVEGKVRLPEAMAKRLKDSDQWIGALDLVPVQDADYDS